MFTDITSNIFSERERDAIDFVSNAGILGGYDNGSFQPANHITFGEFCMIICRLLTTDNYIYTFRSGNRTNIHWAYPYISFVHKTISYILASSNKTIDDFLSAHTFESSNYDHFINTFQCKNIFTLIFSQLSSFQVSISNPHNEITRLTVALIIYDFYQNLQQERSSNNIFESDFKVWSKKNINNYHLNPYLFWGTKGIASTNSKAQSLSDKLLLLSTVGSCITSSDPDIALEQFKCFQLLKETIEKTYSNAFYDTTNSKSAYQYTKISSLYAMLKHSRKKNEYFPHIKLHLSNTAYLNDPDEGTILSNSLLCSDTFTNSNIIETSDTYITSLITSTTELLSMWDRYGDSAQGCRIEFDISNSNRFRLVTYLSSENPQIPSDIQDVFNTIKRIFPHDNFYLNRFLKEQLRKIDYLFKYDAYQSESEIRIIESKPVYSANLLTDPDYISSVSELPKLYIDCDFYLPIKSVTLGPKCPNPEQVALYLKKMNVPIVYRSNIHYR